MRKIPGTTLASAEGWPFSPKGLAKKLAAGKPCYIRHHPRSMNIVEFFSPTDGNIIVNPDIELLKILFLDEGSEYWNAGSGDSCLDYIKEEKANRIEILFSSAFGFYLKHQSLGNDYHS